MTSQYNRLHFNVEQKTVYGTETLNTTKYYIFETGFSSLKARQNYQ